LRYRDIRQKFEDNHRPAGRDDRKYWHGVNLNFVIRVEVSCNVLFILGFNLGVLGSKCLGFPDVAAFLFLL